MRAFPRITGVLFGAMIACSGEAPSTLGDIEDLPDSVTFATDIAPIVYENCAVCHRPAGHGPFSLLTHRDVRSQAAAIAAAVTSRRMPPWLPEPGPFPFVGERRLTARQMALVRRWVDQGTPLGDSTAVPPTPEFPGGWQMGQPDMIVRMTEPYVLAASGPDHFRNFVIPIPIEQVRYVRAVDLQPGEGHAVHHAVINIDRTRSSRRADARDPLPGFDGMFAGSAARPPEGFFLGWTPGNVAHGGTEGLAWRLEPGTDLVLQLHLQPRGHEQQVRAAIGLYFTDQPPTVLSYWLTLGSRQIDIPAGSRDVAVVDSYQLPVDAEVLGLYPHAHYLGDEITGTATLPSGEEISLLRIVKWDFNQQDVYRFVKPVALPQGTRLMMRITFDNTAENPHNPTRPPRRVSYGPASSDEMANLFVQLQVRDSADLGKLAQGFGLKYQGDLKAGFEFLLRVAPDNVAYRVGLGDALAAEGRFEDAKTEYRRALQVQPTYQDARYGLGRILQNEDDLTGALELFDRVLLAEPDNVGALFGAAEVFQVQGDLTKAVQNYLRVIDIEPTHANAYNNLGNAMVEARRPRDAVRFYLRAVELQPGHADARNNLGNLYRELGELENAIVQYRMAVASRPRHSLARFNLGRALVEHGDVAEGLEQMRVSTQLEPDWPVAWATLAWTLATFPADSVRDPQQAIADATRANDLTGDRHPTVLDALAAAYAAAGQFDLAVEAARKGIGIARESGDEDLAGRIQTRLALYERGEAYVVKN